MYQAIDAISKSGVIQLLEPIEFEENEPLVVLRLSKKSTAPETAIPLKRLEKICRSTQIILRICRRSLKNPAGYA